MKARVGTLRLVAFVLFVIAAILMFTETWTWPNDVALVVVGLALWSISGGVDVS